MNEKPKKWIAVGLGLIAQPIGMLYVARPGWAAVYFILTAALLSLDIFLVRSGGWLSDFTLAVLAVACAVQAYRFAGSYDAGAARPWYSRWQWLAGIFCALIALTFGYRAFLFEPFRFPGNSMEPSIEPRAYLIVTKWGYGNYGTWGLHIFRTAISAEIRRGDIIAFEYPDDRSIVYAKRVVGLPGDKVAYRDKRLMLNDREVPVREDGSHLHKGRLQFSTRYQERLDDGEHAILIQPDAPPMPFVKEFPLRERCSYTARSLRCDVPAGHYFVLGDNRDNSSDSRSWGFVPVDSVVGKVQYIIQ